MTHARATTRARRDGLELTFSHLLVGRQGVARRGALREAIVVRAARDGALGLGEAAPLAGYGDETPTRSERALRAALAELDVPRRPLSWPSVGEVLAPAARALAGCPAARFACETLLLSLSAAEQGLPLGALLPRGASSLELSTLLPASPRATLGPRAAALEAAGFRVQKLKLWELDGGVDALAAALDDVARAAPLVRVRLDANGACSLEEASSLSQIVDARASQVELVEEPVPTRELGRARLPTRVPIALDESLFSPEAEALLRAGHLAVLKPSLLSLARADELSTLAPACIVTHAFEGPVGYAATCAAAFFLGSPGRAAGLAPHAGLREAGVTFATPLAFGSTLAPSQVVGLGVSLEGLSWR
jgi:L-alanine-DL-glutamate epimerase-like enolase superfamily enzyme